MRAVTALALTVALLAGCAPSATRPFTPADLPAETSSGEPAPQAEATPRVETVRVAPGVRVVVEWPAAPDADTTAMIEVFRDHFADSLRAVVSGGRDTGYLRTVQDEAGRDAYSWVRGFLDAGRSVRGTMRFYALNVSSVTGPGAQLDVCVDQTRLRPVDPATGEEVPRRSWWAREPYLQTAGMRRADDGTWRIKVFRHAQLPSERAKGCLR
ncbi:hypothetical protein [Streptosporangium fragile]|uniref:hypothetical protein n=1 Tax=Streptosporangium fragile TaxID=46186 RepID=UPI0031F15167